MANKKLVVILAIICAVSLMSTMAVFIFKKDNNADENPSANSSQTMNGALGDIYSGEELESMEQTWSDYLENLGDNELELEIVPDVSNTSSTTSSTSSAVTSGSTATTSSKPASSTSSAATSGSTTTTSSKPASSSSSSDDGWMPGIW